VLSGERRRRSCYRVVKAVVANRKVNWEKGNLII
jgi:hypothetical protein